MKNIEKLFELLDKRTLAPEEQSLLNDMLAEDEESRKFYDFYQKLEQIVKNSSHIGEKDLAEYILFKNEVKTENFRCSVLPKIEEHLRKCPQCTANFKRLNAEYSELDNFLSPVRMVESAPAQLAKTASSKPKFIYTSLAAAAVLFLLLIISSDLSTPYYYNYAGLKDQSEFYVTRGRGTSYFQQSVQELQDNNYDKAIDFLKKDISENPEDETIFYSYYVIGLSYMKAAEKSTFGLFSSFDKSKADEALKNFKNAVEKNTSGKYPNITMNAYFYSAKAYLMMDNLPLAKEYFQKVVSEKGSKMNEAKRILSELE
jgi:tetratricopeptide (TPR) repeat protein